MKVLAIIAAVMAIVVLGGPRADARAWPKPPAAWLNSADMRCVRTIESGNGRHSTNLYGMKDGWAAAGGRGSAWNASRAEQHYRAWILWRRYGCHQPWGRFDGCC